MEQQTMAATMAPTMAPANAHKDIPGNPSTSKSSNVKLNNRSNGEPLRVLSEDDWKFWIENGYIVIKNAVPKEQVKRMADFLWEFISACDGHPSGAGPQLHQFSSGRRRRDDRVKQWISRRSRSLI